MEFFRDLYDVVLSIWQGIKEEPDKYQTLIGGLLALLGVLGTIVVSGWRLRRQLRHALNLDERRHKRELEARHDAVLNALSAELSVITSFLREEEIQLRKFIDPGWKTLDELQAEAEERDKSSDQHKPPKEERETDLSLIKKITKPYKFSMPDRTLIYRSLAPQISALTHDEITNIITAYDQFKSFTSFVYENGSPTGGGSDLYSFTKSKIEVLLFNIISSKTRIDAIQGDILDQETRKLSFWDRVEDLRFLIVPTRWR